MRGKLRLAGPVAVAGFLLAPAGPARAETYVLPSSAFRGGTNGAEYRTDLRLLNQGTGPVTVNAFFYDQVTSTTVTANPFRIEARNQAAFDNVLKALFGKTLGDGAYGPIRFEASGPLLVASSVNNVNACGSGAVSGQWLPAVSVSEALTAGVIGQLAVSSSAAAGYRTNLVFVNPSAAAATAVVKVRRGGGALLANQVIGPLPPNGFRQMGLDSFPGVGGSTDTNLWVEFTSDRPLISYATVIHNVSGDPFAVVASRDVPPAGTQEKEVTYILPGGVPLVMVLIPAGTFQMGSPATERGTWSGEQPVHPVTLTKDYYIGKYEVTQAQWQAVMGTNPSYFRSCGGDCPVEQVSWDDVRGPNGFLAKLNQLWGTTSFRLPTEAEWERAARGGTQSRFSFGDALGGDDLCGANSQADPYVWWCADAGETPHAAGTKKPNAYGLYDMHGNVSEWVEDWYGSYPATAQTNPSGPSTSSFRVFRGGSWFNGLTDARSASRDYNYPATRSYVLGLRLSWSQ